MKRKGLSWDGGRKRLIAAVMMLSVLAAPGVAHAATVDGNTGVSSESVSVSVELTAPMIPTTRSFFGVSWS